MSVPYTPQGSHTLTPTMIVRDAARAVAFYRRAFGAQETRRLTAPDGPVVHCELRVGDSTLNLAEAMPGWPLRPLLGQLYVPDADAVFERAVAAGAEVVEAVADRSFGFREGRVRDPFGSTWTIATQTVVLSTAEMQRRLDAEAVAGSRPPEAA